MTITVKHKFVSAIPDEADATVVRPSNWNDTHDIVGLGTSASLDAGVANGVATLDSSGTVPTSQLPSLSGSYVPYTGATGAVDLNAKTLVNIANLGVNTTTVPTIKIRAVGDNNSTSRIAMRGYSSDANSSSIRVSKFRGSVAAPQAPLSGDSLGKFELAGYGTTSADAYPQSSLEGVATENWGATARGAKAVVKVTPNTTTTQVTALTIDQNSAATFASSVAATSFSGSGSSLTGVVTSVATSGTVNGITLTGGPITSTGTVTLGGTLDLSSPPTIGNTSANTGAFTTLKASSNTLLAQSYDNGTGVLQVTGASSFNGAVIDKSLNLQGGNNLFTYSQLLTNVIYGNLNITIGSAVTAPDGTTTAFPITPSVTSGSHALQYTVTPLSGNTYTVSQVVKANGYNFCALQILFGGLNAYCSYNLSTGALTGVSGGGGTGAISSLGNGWYRVSLTATTTATTTGNIQFRVENDGSLAIYAGNGISGVLMTDNQLELGSVASAYTPTTTAAVTTTNNINVPSGQVLASNGSNSLPSYSFASRPDSGFENYSNGAVAVVMQTTPTHVFNYSSTGDFGLLPTGRISWASTSALGSPDLFLYRDAANTLAQRNSTNAQAFRLYNSYTSSSVGEWLSVDWTTTANTATIATKANGAGVVRTLATGNPLVISTGYTVATLPAGVIGMRAYVTDALAPIYLGTLTGGGAIKCPVFYNGTAWVSA